MKNKEPKSLETTKTTMAKGTIIAAIFAVLTGGISIWMFYSGETFGITFNDIKQLLTKGNVMPLATHISVYFLKEHGADLFDNSHIALPLAQKLLEHGLQHNIDDPIWEWKYGDLSKVYIKIFKKGQYNWQQKFNLKHDVDKIPQALLDNGFDPSLETKVVTHGYIDDGIVFHNAFARANQISGWKSNIIGIDWHEMAQSPYYYSAAKNTEKVGNFVGEQLLARILIHELKQDPKLIHAIGHSLGAHVSGHIGRAVQTSIVASTIGRVTGLDPAEPYFYQVAQDAPEFLGKRILSTDAEFVDIIHTNGNEKQRGSIAGLTQDTYGLGFFDALGDVDFYVNGGGPVQAGCNPPKYPEKNCHHQRAWQYYVESMEKGQTSFKSTACDSYQKYKQGNCTTGLQIPMGESLSKSMLGNDNRLERAYFLDTLPKPDQLEPPFNFSP